MIRAAGATALLAKELDGLDGSGSRSTRSVDRSTRSTDSLGKSVDKSGASIDKFSGRLGLLANVAGMLGPSLIPIGAIGIPALAGLAAQFGFAALGAGTAIGAFQGVGDALKAMNKAHLEPTTANLQAAQIAMEQISPAAQDFVKRLREMGPALTELRDTAASGMFPGLTEGLDSMESLLPKVQRIVGAVAGELGAIGADTGASLASGRWADFFDFLATDAPSALRDMATAAGNTGHAMAEMWMAFDPMNDDFSTWLVGATDSLDKWATGLSKTDGFAEFVSYIQSTGPQVGETLAAIGSALLQVVEAAAPVGGPILAGIEAFAKAVSAIADSDLGTPIFGMVAAMSALNLAMRTAGAASARFTAGGVASQSMLGRTVAGYQGQLTALKGLPAAYRGAAAAQRGLVTAQREAGKTTAQYVGQLKASNTVAATGFTRSAEAHARLADSLGKVQMANFAVRDATERAAAAEKARSAAFHGSAAAAGKAAALVAGLTVVTTGLGDELGVTNTASLALMGSMGGPWGVALGAAAGAAIDLSHANDDLRTSTTNAQAAMKAGDIGAMSAQYDKLGKKIKETTDVSFWDPRDADAGFKKILAQITGVTGEAEKAQSELATMGAASTSFDFMKEWVPGFEGIGSAAASAAGQVGMFQNSLMSLNDALSGRENLLNYTDALLNARSAIKETGKTMTASGKAFKGHQRVFQDSQHTLIGLAGAALNAAKDMSPLKGARYLQNARKDFTNIAHAMGMSRGEARALATKLLELGGVHAKPKVDEIGAEPSSARVKKLRADIASLRDKIVQAKENGASESSGRVKGLRAAIATLHDKAVSITVTTTRITAFKQTGRNPGNNTTGGPIARADGGTIPGPRYPYGDKILAHLAPGEEVVSNRFGQADRFRADRAAGRIPAYADGGRVRRHPTLHGPGHDKNDTGLDELTIKQLNRRFRLLTATVESSTKAIDKERSVRDAIASRRAELGSTVKDKFTSDLFGESTNPWAKGGGVGGLNAILKGDTAKANATKALLRQLTKKGLNGQAYAEVAANADVGQTQALAKMSRAQIGQFETLFNRRARASSAVGAVAGTAVYGAQQAKANVLLTAMYASLRRAEHILALTHKEQERQPAKIGHHVKKGVDHHAAKGKRGRHG